MLLFVALCHARINRQLVSLEVRRTAACSLSKGHIGAVIREVLFLIRLARDKSSSDYCLALNQYKLLFCALVEGTTNSSALGRIDKLDAEGKGKAHGTPEIHGFRTIG
jgi:hypothetical protein